MTRAAYLPAVLAALAMTIVACAPHLPLAGVSAGSKGRYTAVAVAPLLADNIRIGSTRTAAAWDTPGKAVRIVAELLEPAGTAVTAIDVSGLAAGDARQLGDGLRAAGRLPGSGVVLALRQNAIDSRGRQYSPALDFLLWGPVGLAVGAATHDEYFQPTFFLTTGEPLESPRCVIGFDASLIDGSSGAVRAEARGVFGLENLPSSVGSTNWAALSDEQRATAETYCIAALRRGVSEAIASLGLLTR